MSVVYKDIDDLSQKSSVVGTEKIPVSDTQYITPEQIVSGKVDKSGDTMDDDATLEFTDSSGDYTIMIDPVGGTRFLNADDGFMVGVDVVSPEIRVGAIDNSSYTGYGEGVISIRNNNSTNFIQFPSSSGTLALASQIPSVPTVNDSTITIQMNGSTVDTFTTNAASAKTINLGTVITSHQDISTKANVDPGDYSLSGPHGIQYIIGHDGDYYAVGSANAGGDEDAILATTDDIPSLSGYAKYVLCQDEAAYTAIQNKDSGTLYLIPKTS